MGLLFSGFNVTFLKLQNGHILAIKLNFETLSPLSFLKLLKLEMPLFLYILAYFPRYRYDDIMDSTLLLQQKSILQYISQVKRIL